MKINNIEINRKDIPVGDVVYYVRSLPHGELRIGFGTVEEQYRAETSVQLYDACELRTINGVPVEDIVTPTRWQKLPKDWSWRTRLFTLDHRPYPKEVADLRINVPADILKAIECGALVKVQDLDDCRFEEEIDARQGWRIRRKYDRPNSRPAIISLPFYKVYTSYEEAKSALDAEQAELDRQSGLTDYEWSVEQIDRVLDLWAGIYGTKEEKVEYRNRILGFERVEDIEVRISKGEVQWKYWKNKKWINLR